jgi:hypothetical protein
MTACCERLIGCIECNRWSWRGGDRLFMELSEEDLEALRAVKKETAPRRLVLRPLPEARNQEPGLPRLWGASH